MATVDWIILAAIALLALQGWRTGFLGGVFSLAGFALGALLTARAVPAVLPDGASSRWAPTLALVGAAAGGFILAGLFERVGSGLRRALPVPFLGVFDRALGLGLGVFTALVAAWLTTVALMGMPGTDRFKEQLRSSTIVPALQRLMPSTESLLGLVSRFDPLPGIAGPEAGRLPAPPDAGIAVADWRAASSSVVRVRSSACGLSIEGSGWVAESGLVVTNAHVVAGDRRPTVQPGGVGPASTGETVVFDRVDDIAVLRVVGLRAAAIGRSSSSPVGAIAALLGFPLDRGFSAEPVRVGQTVDAVSADAYGTRQVRRRVMLLRGRIRPGNSGGPVIDRSGRVVATVYGRAVGSGHPGGFAVPSQVVDRDLAKARLGAFEGAGPCPG